MGTRMDTSLAAEAEATSLAASDEERQTKAKSSAADTSLAAEEQVAKRQPKAKSSAADTSPTQLPTPASAAESIAAEALAPDEFEC